MHIESRSSKRTQGEYEFIVEIYKVTGDVQGAIEELKKQTSYFQIISRNHNDSDIGIIVLKLKSYSLK